MPPPDFNAQSADPVRYSVTPTDVATVQRQLNDVSCDEQMVQQYIQATGGNLNEVSAVAIFCGACNHKNVEMRLPQLLTAMHEWPFPSLNRQLSQ